MKPIKTARDGLCILHSVVITALKHESTEIKVNLNTFKQQLRQKLNANRNFI